MKNKSIKIITFSLLIISGIWLSVIFAGSKFSQTQNVFFEIKSNKNKIILGEIIQLEFEFFNNGEKAVKLTPGGVKSGNTLIFIAKKGGFYREYITTGWGMDDSEKLITLMPGQTYKADNEGATILWNSKPNYSHLNTGAAKEMDKTENRIRTDYAFPESGDYLIKAHACLIDENNSCSIWIESEPIEIIVEQPENENLLVWERLNKNPRLGRFMQDNGDSSADQNVLNEIKELVDKYPNSFYAKPLQQSLEKYNFNKERRKSFLEKLRKQNNLSPRR